MTAATGEGPVWHFVRHAQSTANAEGWLAGHADAPLTAEGQAAARALAPEVRSLRLERAFTSDLERAWHTAELLLEDHDVQPRRIQGLRERDLGDWERESYDRLDAQDPHLYRWDLGPPGGESPRDVARRFLSFFAVCPDVPGETLVVAHGLALKALVGLIDGVPTQDIVRFGFGNLERRTRRVSRARFEALLAELESS